MLHILKVYSYVRKYRTVSSIYSFVMFMLFLCAKLMHSNSDIYQHIKIQHRTLAGSMNVETFTSTSARQEFLGLMVMAWETLKGQAVPRNVPLDML